MNLGLIFLTGLTTGGLSCLVLQGGLLASAIVSESKKNSPRNDHRLIIAVFLLAKLLVHIAFGFVLGFLGSVVSLSPAVRLFFQTFTAFFMFATAMNLLNVHPIFRYVVFQPPNFLRKLIKKSSLQSNFFTPVILGLLTLFIPCGVTQAMEVSAINSGSAIYGALIMFAFILGTMPIFVFLGLTTQKLSENWQRQFSRTAAVFLILMSIYSLNGVMVVLDSPITLNKIFQPVKYFFSEERFDLTSDSKADQKSKNLPKIDNGIQKITINVLNNGYYPKYIVVRQNIPVELELKSNETYSCALSFVFREFNINAFLKASDTQTFNFIPKNKGKFVYTCSMGMYTGTMEVI